tara:strand:+ start:489 stop:731 length:243 start_codon:yes stop_codon:yes gene_type:complete
MPKVLKNRKKAKASAKKDAESAKRLGVSLDEKKLFKQNLHGLKATKALVQSLDAAKKGKTGKAKRKRKKYDRQTKKMFKA